jgi:multisubunit Na+/H+ antiporter MnhE subunit
LTPGTVTIDIEGDMFIVHAIDTKVAADLPGEMEQRVAAVFKEEQCNLPEGKWG